KMYKNGKPSFAILLGCCISCCGSKNTSKISIFRSFSMKFFFSSKQECMTNMIQSVFLSVTHVFVSILKLFKKLGPKSCILIFKLLIFGYISRFLTKFLTLLGFFYALNTNPPLVFILDLENMVKKWFIKRYLIIGKNPLFGFYPRMGYLPVVKIKKFLRIRVPHAEKPPSTKNQPNWKTFCKFDFFTPRRDQRVFCCRWNLLGVIFR